MLSHAIWALFFKHSDKILEKTKHTWSNFRAGRAPVVPPPPPLDPPLKKGCTHENTFCKSNFVIARKVQVTRYTQSKLWLMFFQLYWFHSALFTSIWEPNNIPANIWILEVGTEAVCIEIWSPGPFMNWAETGTLAAPTFFLIMASNVTVFLLGLADDVGTGSLIRLQPRWHKVHNIKSKCYI